MEKNRVSSHTAKQRDDALDILSILYARERIKNHANVSKHSERPGA